MKPSNRKFLEIGKTVSDYLLVLAGEGVALYISTLTPRGQLFSVLDPTISFPMAAHETVPIFLAYLLCFVAPAAIVLLLCFAFGPGNFVRRLKLFNGSILGLLTAVVVAQFFTEVIKLIIGRPRPDFLSRCQPDAQKAQAAFTATAVALFNSAICTSTDAAAMADGFKSFPSGHSSTSFAGLTYLSLWMAGRLRLFVPHSPHGKHLYAYIISAAPLLVASFIASSRVIDYRHRGFDVLGGTVLGIFWGIVGYRYYYPWVSSPIAGTPWMVMIEESENEPLLPTARLAEKPRVSDESQTDRVTAVHGETSMEADPFFNRGLKAPQ